MIELKISSTKSRCSIESSDFDVVYTTKIQEEKQRKQNKTKIWIHARKHAMEKIKTENLRCAWTGL